MIRIKVDDSQVKLTLKDTKGRLRDMRPVFTNFHVYMMRRVQLMFERLKSGGTSFRGVGWMWFARQYTRKDGTIVPAEGGVPKVRGNGLVKGRKRHSGKRVTRSSNLMRDTGRLSSAALAFMRMSKSKIEMDTKVNYAGYQHRMRAYQFFEEPKDIDVLRDMAIRRLGNA
jgi:hypothetical protein